MLEPTHIGGVKAFLHEGEYLIKAQDAKKFLENTIPKNTTININVNCNHDISKIVSEISKKIESAIENM